MVNPSSREQWGGSLQQVKGSARQAIDANTRTRARRKRRRRARAARHGKRCEAREGSRAARRLADPQVQARREAHEARVAAEGEARGEAAAAAAAATDQSGNYVNNDDQLYLSLLRSADKRTYTKERMLSLRPRPASSLSAASPIFVPHVARYSCHARAVRLGLADAPDVSMWQRPVLSAVARELCARVHSLLALAAPCITHPACIVPACVHGTHA